MLNGIPFRTLFSIKIITVYVIFSNAFLYKNEYGKCYKNSNTFLYKVITVNVIKKKIL